MLQALETKPGLQFGSFLYRSDLLSQADLFLRWVQEFGASFSFSPSQNPLAQYYAKEMGEGNLLKRFFVVTTSTFKRDKLLASKLLSIDWERSWSVEGKRTVNLDIGMLAAENFILATTKNYSHRVYLGQDIFADLTYYFHQGKLQTLPWTYPDYVDEEKIEFFTWCRSYLLEQLSNP